MSMRILAVGDTHGNTEWVTKVVYPNAERLEVDLILQVGDFGFWPHYGWGKDFLYKLSHQALKTEIPVFWIDGNHDNHDVLEENGMFESDYPVPVPGYEGIVYLPRGIVVEFDGLSFLMLGGAHSIDEHSRILGVSWWEQELITEAQAMKAMSHGQVDVMICHDAPEVVDVPGPHAAWKDDFPKSRANRSVLQQVFQVAEPELLVHGHHHVRYSLTAQATPQSRTSEIAGLGMDRDIAGNMVLLELADERIDCSSVNPVLKRASV